MNIINIKNNDKFLTEYIKLCCLEWGSAKNEKQLEEYLEDKKKKIQTEDKVLSILGLIKDDNLLGFISLFKHDGAERRDLTPWYATMYIKKEYRGKGYSKILNNAILKEADKLGYKKLYLKTNLINYYEKFGAQYIEKMSNGDQLYYYDLNK